MTAFSAGRVGSARQKSARLTLARGTALPAAALLGLLAGGAGAQTTASPATSAPATTTPADSGAAPQGQAPVVIQGQKATNKIDRQVYDNTKNIDSTTGTASDALNKVPSVNVDNDGNVTLRGNSNVQVYVDGKPSAMMSGDNRAAALQAMSSGDIDSVEVMTNPGAQYSSEGSGGIINLVMKKNRKPGGNGVLTGAVGSAGRYNGAFTGSYRVGKMTFSGGLNYRHDGRTANLGSVLQQLGPDGKPTSTTLSSGGGKGTMNNLSINGGVDYAADDTNSFGVQGNYSNRRMDTVGDTTFDTYNASNTKTGSYTRHTTTKSPHEDQMLDFSWNHTGDKTGETLKTDLRLSRSDGDTDTANLSTYSLPTASTVSDTKHQTNDLRNGVFSVDYNRYVGQDQLSTGIQITYDDNSFINSATGLNSASLNSDFAYTQTISAAYITYQKQFGDKWTVLGGLRSETLDLKTDQVQGTSRTESHIDYTKLSPSFFATYTLSPEGKIRFSYSHRLQRPAPQDLNPYQVYVDTQNVTAGNPNLKPQETDSFELGYEYSKGMTAYQIRGYYRKNTNTITSYSYFLTPGVLLTTKQNYGTGESGGLEGNFNGKLTKSLSVNVNGNLAYYELTTPDVGGKQSATTLSGRIGLNYTATLKDTVQFSYFSSGKQLTGQGYRAPFMMGNFSYRHTFNPKLALVVNVNDPFRTGRFKTVTDTTTVHSEQVRSMQGQIFYLGLSYTLGGPAPAGQQNPQGQRQWGGPGGPGGGPGGPGGGGGPM